MRADNKEALIQYLEKLGLKVTQKVNDKFTREIYFEVGEVEYMVKWYINQSMLRIGKDDYSPFIHFKYVNVESSYPTSLTNKRLCFYDEKQKDTGFMYNEIPFGCIRIPLPDVKE